MDLNTIDIFPVFFDPATSDSDPVQFEILSDVEVSIPEPPTIYLFGIAGLGLILIRSRPQVAV